MFSYKSKKSALYIFLTLLLILVLYFIFFNFITNNFENKKKLALEPISLKLLTSVHPNLSWDFKPVKDTILIKPGDVTTVEYVVQNLGAKETTGIATFAYFPKVFGEYVSKINCFCYDAQTLKPMEKDKFVLAIFIDPEVTKNSKTKRIKDVTIQFTFFDYKEYKENKS